MKRMLLSVALGVAVSIAPLAIGQAMASDYNEYPAPAPGYPFQRSVLSGRAVVIPPYRHVFPIRIYATPQQQPYYNVPPYAVISPY